MSDVGETCSLAALAASWLPKVIISSAKAPMVEFTVRERVGGDAKHSERPLAR